MKKTIYKTTIIVTILSQEPINDMMSLSDLGSEMSDGEYTGKIDWKSPVKVSGILAAKLIKSIGSDPEFLGMDDKGNDLDE